MSRDIFSPDASDPVSLQFLYSGLLAGVPKKEQKKTPDFTLRTAPEVFWD